MVYHHTTLLYHLTMLAYHVEHDAASHAGAVKPPLSRTLVGLACMMIMTSA